MNGLPAAQVTKPRSRAAEVRQPGRHNDFTPDLGTQLEDLLVTVWECERRARVDDRIDAIVRSNTTA